MQVVIPLSYSDNNQLRLIPDFVSFAFIPQARHSGDQYADETSQLAKAFAKYCDAVSIEATHPVYNFHCGRMLLQQKDFKHATRCFQIAVGGKPNCVMYRCVLYACKLRYCA